MPAGASKQRRLPAAERKRQIMEAALPLFARKGPAGATTRDIAEAAGVSEPILYRHFASKDDLFRELESYCAANNAAGIDAMMQIPAGSFGLVLLVYGTVISIVDPPSAKRRRDSPILNRLAAHSLVDDGRFARMLGDKCFSPVFVPWLRHAQAAEAAGELVPGPIAGETGPWLSYLVSMAMGMYSLPQRKTLPFFAEGKHKACAQATWFILRGLGLRDDVIARHLDVDAFRNMLSEV